MGLPAYWVEAILTQRALKDYRELPLPDVDQAVDELGRCLATYTDGALARGECDAEALELLDLEPGLAKHVFPPPEATNDVPFWGPPA